MSVLRRLSAVPAILAVLVSGTVLVAAQPPVGGDPAPIIRGPHVSGVVQVMAHKPPHGGGGGGGSTVSTCATPGAGNYITNCHGTGRPVNETWVTTDSTNLYAGANDYNSYNGIVQDGFYWSTPTTSSPAGVTWNDAGPIDVFPHSTYNAAGDPQLATGNGTVYYSSLLFNYYRCNVGGVELLWNSAASIGSTSYSTTSWSHYQIAANSQSQFQDKPALAVDATNQLVYESWTQYASCSGNGVASPIRVAVFSTSSGSPVLQQILTAPGSTYSQGSSIRPDGSGGFWLTWEEYPTATATSGKVMLAHWSSGSGFRTTDPQFIALDADLPSPLPGFNFRDNSFPVLAMVGGAPWIAWTAQNASGVGRAYLWTATTNASAPLADSGANQFFPAIAPDGSGGAYVSFSQADGPYPSVSLTNSFDQWMIDVSSTGVASTPTSPISTAPSFPNQDTFFPATTGGGKFIGDYNGMTVFDTKPHAQPTWTDIRGPELANTGYSGYQMNSMTYTP